LPNVPVQRQRFVLRGDEDPAISGVQAVAENEVDDAIRAAKVHGRLGSLPRQGKKPLTRATRQDHYENVIVQHAQAY
jgi:hypothetical protein